jgi:hypothetical protein
VGGFGLYEFMWMLNGEYPDMPMSEKRATARAALRRLIDEGGVEIVLLEWPPTEAVGRLTFSDIEDSHFLDPDESLPYAALMPVEVVE